MVETVLTALGQNLSLLHHLDVDGMIYQTTTLTNDSRPSRGIILEYLHSHMALLHIQGITSRWIHSLDHLGMVFMALHNVFRCQGACSQAQGCLLMALMVLILEVYFHVLPTTMADSTTGECPLPPSRAG